VADLEPSVAIRDSGEDPADIFIRGATDNTRIGNNADALKVSITSEIITSFSKTYTAVAADLSLATNPTDIFTISGRASGKVRLASLFVTFLRTNTGYATLQILKRSADNTGGTFTNPTKVPHESTDAAANAVIKAYTANPSALGASVGAIYSRHVFMPSANAASGVQNATIDILVDIGKPITLVNASEFIAISLGGQGVAGAVANITMTWIEE
jgi:hypothetical protein